MFNQFPHLLFFKLFLVCFIVSLSGSVYSQDCLNLFKLHKNAKYEYDLLDKRKKPIGKVRNMVLSSDTDSAGTTLIIKSGVYGPKNNLKHSADYTFRCQNDSVFYDKMMLLDHETIKSFEGKQMTYAGQDLIWPLKLQTGQELPEGNLKIEIIIFNRPVANINHRLFDRKVTGTETIKTPAGTFTCYKIKFTYEVVTSSKDLSLKKQDYGIAYFSPDHGVIKTQFKTRNGKRKLHSIVLHSGTNLPQN